MPRSPTSFSLGYLYTVMYRILKSGLKRLWLVCAFCLFVLLNQNPDQVKLEIWRTYSTIALT